MLGKKIPEQFPKIGTGKLAPENWHRKIGTGKLAQENGREAPCKLGINKFIVKI